MRPEFQLSMKITSSPKTVIQVLKLEHFVLLATNKFHTVKITKLTELLLVTVIHYCNQRIGSTMNWYIYDYKVWLDT